MYLALTWTDAGKAWKASWSEAKSRWLVTVESEDWDWEDVEAAKEATAELRGVPANLEALREALALDYRNP